MIRLLAYIRHAGMGKGVCFLFAFLSLFFSPASSSAAPPVASFSADPTSGVKPLLVSFTDTSIGTLTTWSWAFGDGGIDTLQHPTHTYTDTGFFHVTLTVSGPGGIDDTTMTNLIRVTEPPPVASFSASPTIGDKPLQVNFTDQSTGGGAVTSWSWTFGDGGTDTLQSPTYTYADTGLFDVRLTVTGPGGSDDTLRLDLIDVTEPLVSNFTGLPLTGNPPLTVQFVDRSTGEPGEPISWFWRFGDSSPDSTSTLENPQHTYSSAGTYTVSLTVTGFGGRSDDTTMVDYIVVTEEAPVANFSGSPRSGVVPLTVDFSDSSTGVIDTWAWVFGDGGTDTLQNPQYIYNSPGIFDVSLTVAGPGGQGIEQKPNYITVYDSLSASFTGSPRNGPKPLQVQFTDQSTPIGEISTWKWYFGDGDSSTVQHPQHTYQDSGAYDVTMVITGPAGADTTTETNYIRVTEPPPVAQFSGDPTSGQAPLTVNFTDLSSGAITLWEWDFGDGNVSFVPDPVHEYTRADQFDVSLKVTGPGGDHTETKINYITVTPGEPDTVLVYGITDPIRAGDLSNVTVEIRDQFDNRVSGYSGTVQFSSDDPGNDSLPDDYTFIPATDQGIHTFTNGVALVTVGERYVAVNETGNPSINGKQSNITVQPNDPAILTLSPGDTVNVTVGASRVFTAEVTDNYTNIISGQRIDIFLAGTADGFLSENTGDPNPTFGSGTSRYGFSDSGGHVTVLYTAPGEAGLLDVLDAMAQSFIDSTQVDNVVIRSTASGATKLVILPAGPIVTTANTPFNISIEAQDDLGNLDPSNNSTVLLGSNSASMEFSTDGFLGTITQIILSGGTTSGLQARDQTTGTPSVTADDQAGILAQGTKTNITINPAPADYLLMTGIPDTITAGDSQTVSVEVLDRYDNRVTDYNGTVEFSTNDLGSQVSLPSDYSFLPADAGIHTFDNGIALTTVGSWYVLVRDNINPSVFDIVSDIGVVPASADSLDISGIPGTVEAGSSNSFTVTILDPYDNIVTGYSEMVHFQTNDPGSGVVLPGDYAFLAGDAGVRQFTPGMTLVTVGSWMFEAVEVGNPSVRGSQSGINVTHTTVDSLILSGLPGSTIAGSIHSLTVEAVDRYINRVLNYSGTVVFSSSDPQATVPSSHTFDGGDQGYHTFLNDVIFRTAGDQVVTAIDSTGGITGGTQGTNVSHAEVSSLVITPPDTVPVTVNAGAVFTATARDTYSNPVDGDEVTIFFNDSADGTLHDNPDDPNNTQGTTLWQQGTTDSDGRVTVLYNASDQAGLYDILDATSVIPASSVDDVTIATVAEGATKLVLLPTGDIESRAGESFSLTIEARDNNENRDLSDSTVVLLSSDSDSMKFSTDNFLSTVDTVRLFQGRSQSLRAMDVIIGNPSITVTDVDSIGFRLTPDSKSNITITPSDPSGTIQLSFSGRDTLTADGSSSTSIISQTITDTYGNNVGSGVEVTVSERLGTITSLDVNGGVPGIQVQTDATGSIFFNYRAGGTAGVDTLTAVSVEGDAVGSILLILQSPPALVYTEETLSPNTVSPGTVQEFELVLVNNGEAGVTLHDSSTFNFGDGLTQFSSMLLDSFRLEGNSGQDTIHFRPDTIPSQMPEGAYTPSIDLYGTDSNDAPFHRIVQITDSNRLHVSSLILNSVAVLADTVSHGDSVDVQLEVKNAGTTTTTLNEAGLIFDPPGGQFIWELTGLPLSIPGNATRNINGYINVGSLTPTGSYMIDAFVVGSSSGGLVSDSSANIKDSWVVISAALASYVNGSIQPVAVSGSGTYDFELDLINLGASDINLNENQTHLAIGVDGELFDVWIPREEVMPGDSALTSLTFNTGTVPEPVTPGYYPVTLYLSGNTQYGGTFFQVLELPDSVLVESAPVMSYSSNSISNQVISSEYEYSFSLRVANNGGADLVLDPSQTTFYIEGNDTLFQSTLNSQGSSTITPGTDTTLMFLPATVPGTLASGEHPSFVALRGNYNGVSFTDTLAADPVTIETPSTLRVSKITSPDKASQGETFSVVARVTNLGEAEISTSGTLSLATDSLVVESPELTFGISLPDTVTWQVSVPAGLEPGDYLLTLRIDQVPLDENSGQPAKMDNPQGVTFPISVVEKNQLSLQRIEIDGIPPQNVFKGQFGVPMLPILVRSLGDKEGVIQLDRIEVELEERGGISISNPGNVIDRIYLTGSLGGYDILASATEFSQGKFSLLIPEGYPISDDPDTLFLIVDVTDNAGVLTFQLLIDGEDAVEAVDLATQTRAGIVEGNSDDPLDALRSSFTVLNQRDFVSSFKNYPNPVGSGNGSTTFSYYIPEDAEVSIMIYTLTGSLVRRLVFNAGANGGRGPGVNQVIWDGYNGTGKYVINGVYICFASARTPNSGVQSTRYKLAVMR